MSSDSVSDFLSRIASAEAPRPEAALHLGSLTREIKRLRRRKTVLEPLVSTASSSHSPRSARIRMRIVRRRIVELTRRRADALTDAITENPAPWA